MFQEQQCLVEALKRVSHDFCRWSTNCEPIPGGAPGKLPYSGGRPNGGGSGIAVSMVL